MTVRNLVSRFLQRGISRRKFIAGLGKAGITAAAASQFSDILSAQPIDPTLHLADVSGGTVTCEVLRQWGVRYVFGNTGAYEAGFVDALTGYPDIQYVLGLHEGSVMAMADGYSRITGETSFVNVHSITGTANALGLIVNAWTDSSPVVITVGFSDTTSENSGAFTETPKLEAIPEPYSKLSFRVSRTDTLAKSLRRAFQLASTLPSGPVFLGVPMDVWINHTEEAQLIPPARSLVSGQVQPDPKAITRAAELLAKAENPLLVSGAELPRWGGLAELVDIADLLGATVSGDTSSSRSSLGFPTHHPRYLGPLRRSIEASKPFDVVCLAGASRLTLARRGHPLIPTDARIIELGIREDHLARGYPADVLIYAHPEATLKRLRDELKSLPMSPSRVAERRKMGEGLKASRQKRIEERLREVWDDDPIAPQRLATEIDRAIDDDAVVVTEGVTSDTHIWNHIHFDQPGGGRRHIISAGGSLGWGLGAGIGVKLGAPDKQVVVIVGDGAFQFATQALWTAKRAEVPLILVIFNNRGYQANRWALAGLDRQAAEEGHYIGVNLVDPDIDHVGIARSYGLDGERVIHPEDLRPALERAIEAERDHRAYVLDVVIAREGRGADSNWYEKFRATDAIT